MKKIYFYLILSIFFIGCSSKETTLIIPFKGSQNNFQCRKIKIKSNNPTLTTLFYKYIPNIITISTNKINCNIYIKNSTKKTVSNYFKKVKIIYDNKHPRCIFYKQECILKSNYYFCSNPVKISLDEYNNIKKFKYRHNDYYINNPNSNIAYKIYKKCNPEFIYLHCKKYLYNIKNDYFLNRQSIYSQKENLNIDTCENINEIFYNEITTIKNKLKNYNTYLKNELTYIYNQEIQNFIQNNFPNLQTINIQLIDPESSNKNIENIYNKLIKNKQIDLQDLSIIKRYLKKIYKINFEEYVSVKIIEYTLMLKLKLINNKNKAFVLNNINYLIDMCKNKHLSDDYCNSLYQIKKIISNIFT